MRDAALAALAAPAAPVGGAPVGGAFVAGAPVAGADASCDAAGGDEQPRAPPRVAHASVFAWDHAQPAEGSRLPSTHLLDATRRAGVCGDFFAGAAGLDGVEAAAVSGAALAEALMPLLEKAE